MPVYNGVRTLLLSTLILTVHWNNITTRQCKWRILLLH